MHKKIDQHLSEVLRESPNDGGYYHFTKLNLPEGNDLDKRIRTYLLSIDAYQNPYVYDTQKIMIEGRNVVNLELSPVSNFKVLIEDKLKYWREHKTSLDTRKKVTEQYQEKEDLFKDSLFEFFDGIHNLKIYEIKGLDTFHASDIGGDMVSDDTLFDTGNEVYSLHFGWSS